MLEPRNSQNIIWRSQRALSGTIENGLAVVACACSGKPSSWGQFARHNHYDRGLTNLSALPLYPSQLMQQPPPTRPRLRDLANPADIVAFDLARSGQFDPMAKENMLSYPRIAVAFFSGLAHTQNCVFGYR
ncbi:MAG: hypothetical protein CM15mP68_0890 [Pseudomonadota bacterium]|nr:MAG: hypothetical protein CM15mP68_0890 [Pseudomonadota bacterium]